jgi:hypothetical protein
MTGIEIIVAALAAGATAGGTAVVQDAYATLRDAVRRRLRGRGSAEQALELAAEETDPGVWQTRIGAALADSGADRDEEVLAAARALLAVTDPAGVRAGKYTVDLRGAQGVQVGDHNNQTNTFN